MNIPVIINGEKYMLQEDPDEKLIEVLRKQNLFSVKLGCAEGICGSCTVLLNGKPVPACKLPVALAMNQEIITLEHFSKTPEYAVITKGFAKAGIKLCGYCNAGKFFAAASILSNKQKPTRSSVREQVKHLSPCCTDIDTLINGIIYAAEIQSHSTKEV